MSDLEGNIYEPWIRWKSESESKSDSDNMQGPVIPECEETKGLKWGQELDKYWNRNMPKLISYTSTWRTGKTVLLKSIATPRIEVVNDDNCQKFNITVHKFGVSNLKMKPDFADVERDAFTEGIDTFNAPNVMKEVDYQQLVDNTGLKMNRDQESSSPSAFQSITKETFYQYMISLLLCYQVLGCWMTKNIMIVTQALKYLENNGVITQFPLLFLFSEVILESWIQLNRKNPDRMQWGKHGGNHNTSNQKTLNMGDFKFRGWNQGSQRVCSRVTRQFLLPPNFNEAISLSEPLPNEDNVIGRKEMTGNRDIARLEKK